jgi:DNA-directed RNA polymerase beta subunit
MIKTQLENQTKGIPDIKDDLFLGIELIVPHANKTDAGRLNMCNSHILQSLVLNNPQIPRLYTRYENQVGEVSPTYKVASEDFKILKISKVNGINHYIIEKLESKVKDILIIEKTFKFTESYSALLINHLENKKEGDIVKKGEIIFRSTAYDEYLNLMIGTNVKAVFLSYFGKTYEDAIVLNKEAVHKFNSTYTTEIEFNLNTNEILLNLYGDDDNYKAFPDIGEKVQNRIVVGKRTINYNKLLINGSDKELRKPDYDLDKIYYTSDSEEAIVTGIEIRANGDTIRETGAPFYHQLRKYLVQEEEGYRDIIEFLDGDKGKMSEDLEYYSKKFKDILNPDIKFEKKGVIFDNLNIKITIVETHSVVEGSKITNLYGKLH